MKLPKIKIVNNWVFIDGVKAKKKYLSPDSHCREIFYNDLYVVKLDYDDEYFDQQNSCEARVWKLIDEDDRMYLYREIYMANRTVKVHAETINRLSSGEVFTATVADHDASDRATLAENHIPTIVAKSPDAKSAGVMVNAPAVP